MVARCPCHSLTGMRRISHWALAAAIACSLLLAPPARGESLAWEPCGTGQECAWLTVPVDHAEPDGATIDLRVVRILARGTNPIGSLVVNPGGPGASGAEFVRFLAVAVPESLRQNFHLVGFDPRGVGQSSPIRCTSAPVLARYLRTDITPTTSAAQRLLMRRAAQFGPGCLADQPRLAPNLDSLQTVADMDRLRAALGDPRLNFLGFSYGTLLGARYAEAYPDRVGRLVLDGAVDPALDLMQISQAQSTGFQVGMRRFAAACARQSRCPLGRTSTAVLESINGLLKRLESRPLPAAGGTTLVQSQAITAIFTALYSPGTWPVLVTALAQARRGDGTGLQRLAYLGNDQVGPERFASNLNFAFIATSCLDSPAPPGRVGLASAARQWSRGAAVPELSRALAWSNAPCTTWFRHGETSQQVQSTTDQPMLIIGTRFDPATPYRWSRTLHEALPTSVLLTYEGDGHTAFAAGSRCVDSAVTRFLLTGAAEQTTCRP
jgi:pimeloyl-ACP methyl ester carboxylesterase